MLTRVLFGLAAAAVLSAQTISLAGVVSDRQGRAIPGVTVTTIPESGGPVRHATSGSDGTYRFDGLPDGTYRVDFELRGFEVIRRNHVRVQRNTAAKLDAELPVRPICECVGAEMPSPWAQRAGQVVDSAGRPLPHARIELVGREVAYADREGRFLLRLPVNQTWELVASDTGFRRATQRVSGADAAAAVLSLEYGGTTNVSEQERLGGCECQQSLLSYDVP